MIGRVRHRARGCADRSTGSCGARTRTAPSSSSSSGWRAANSGKTSTPRCSPRCSTGWPSGSRTRSVSEDLDPGSDPPPARAPRHADQGVRRDPARGDRRAPRGLTWASPPVLRPSILGVAHARWFRRLATRQRAGRARRRPVRRRRDPRRGDRRRARRDRPTACASMLSQLGENVETRRRQALAAREAYLAGARGGAGGARARRDASRSKLTQLGLDESVEACWANARADPGRGAAHGTVVMIDMESHAYVDATLGSCGARTSDCRGRASRSRRTSAGAPSDVFALPAGCRVRLVKGAYLEPPRSCSARRREVDASYAAAVHDAAARGHRSTSPRTTRRSSRRRDTGRRARRRLVAGRVPDAVRCPPGPAASLARRRGIPSACTSRTAPSGTRTSRGGWPSGPPTCGSSCRTW